MTPTTFLILSWLIGATALSVSYYIYKNLEKILKIATPLFLYLMLPIMIGSYFLIMTETTKFI